MELTYVQGSLFPLSSLVVLVIVGTTREVQLTPLLPPEYV